MALSSTLVLSEPEVSSATRPRPGLAAAESSLPSPT